MERTPPSTPSGSFKRPSTADIRGSSSKRHHVDVEPDTEVVEIDSPTDKEFQYPPDCFTLILPSRLRGKFAQFLLAQVESEKTSHPSNTNQTTASNSNTTHDYSTSASHSKPTVEFSKSDRDLQDLQYAHDVAQFLNRYRKIKKCLFGSLGEFPDEELAKNTDSQSAYNKFKEIRKDITRLYVQGQLFSVKQDTQSKATKHSYVRTETAFLTQALNGSDLDELNQMSEDLVWKQNHIIRYKVLKSLEETMDKVDQHLNNADIQLLVAKAFRVAIKSNRDVGDSSLNRKRTYQNNSANFRQNHQRQDNHPVDRRQSAKPTNNQQNSWPNNNRTNPGPRYPTNNNNNHNNTDSYKNNGYNAKNPQFQRRGNYNGNNGNNNNGNNNNRNYRNNSYNNNNNNNRNDSYGSNNNYNNYNNNNYNNQRRDSERHAYFQDDEVFNYEEDFPELPEHEEQQRGGFSNQGGPRGRFKGGQKFTYNSYGTNYN